MPRRDFLPRSAPRRARSPLTPVGQPDPAPAPLPKPPTPEEAALARQYAERSRDRSRRIVDAALSEPCGSHHAARGVYCYAAVKGICKERRERGQFLAQAIPLVDGVGQLAPAATAVRNATRDQRFREWDARRREWRASR
jgi:hypothetical protein